MQDKVKELTLEELELVKGGFTYAGFYRYRAEVLNIFKIEDQSSKIRTNYTARRFRNDY